MNQRAGGEMFTLVRHKLPLSNMQFQETARTVPRTCTSPFMVQLGSAGTPPWVSVRVMYCVRVRKDGPFLRK